MIDPLVITESTTRKELLVYISGLEDEVQELEIKIENQKLKNLALAPKQLDRLTDAADTMAELGRIHNTPHAKSQWISGN